METFSFKCVTRSITKKTYTAPKVCHNNNVSSLFLSISIVYVVLLSKFATNVHGLLLCWNLKNSQLGNRNR